MEAAAGQVAAQSLKTSISGAHRATGAFQTPKDNRARLSAPGGARRG